MLTSLLQADLPGPVLDESVRAPDNAVVFAYLTAI